MEVPHVAMLTCEILITRDTANRGRTLLNAMARSGEKAGVEVNITQRYTGTSDWLMLWGVGEAYRNRWFTDHLQSGRHAIAWDLGYWDRRQLMRVSIDAIHPQDLIWKMPLPADRFDSLGIQFQSTVNKSGPIIFASMGRKSRALYGNWDDVALASLRRRFPDRNIIVRDKPTSMARTNEPNIDEVLNGASLVVTRHSNVTIDAMIAGVPFECSDGAAMAYRGDRLAFLRQLAWFQWNHEEAPQAWRFLREMTT